MRPFSYLWKIFLSCALLLIPCLSFAHDGDAHVHAVNSTTLPFLHEASSGQNITTVQHNTADENVGVQNIDALKAKQKNKKKSSKKVNSDCAFQDIQGHRSEEAIQYLQQKKVVKGRQPCYFQPNAKATRAEAATMAVRAGEIITEVTTKPAETFSQAEATEKPKSQTKPFPDVSTNKWSTAPLQSAKEKGIIHGYPDGLYRPDQPVNKVEALKILTRTFENDFSKVNFGQLKAFSDIELNQWYIPYIQAGLDYEIIPLSSTKIEPSASLTRAEFSEMLYILVKSHKED